MYAGFWKRLVAFVIDTLIGTLAAFVFGFAAGLILGAGGTSEDALATLGNLIGVVVMWLYFALMESSEKQATFGKQWLGMRVTDAEGKRISFGRATGRHFGKILSSLLVCIGYLMIAFTKKKQGLHDMMASCVVVNKGAPAGGIQEAPVV